MKRLGKTLTAIGITATVVFCILLATQNTMLPHVMRWLDVGKPPVATDAAFLLLGDEDSRPFVAAALYNAGLTKRILLGRYKPFENDPYTPPSHLINRDVLIKRGVSDNDIVFLGEGISNTMNESQELGTYLTENPDAIVAVVTSHFHTRRTSWTMRRLFGKDADRLRFVSTPHQHFDFDNWWRDTEGFQLIMMEYVKLIGYWVCYGNGLYWLSGMVVCIAGVSYFRRRSVAPRDET